jgi:acyl-coenzyme A synthetase/AMP-(fatty) acid ligase
VAVDAANDLGRRRALRQQYWSQIEGIYFAGDGARRDRTAISG